jgi:hypothetical protein
MVPRLSWPTSWHGAARDAVSLAQATRIRAVVVAAKELGQAGEQDAYADDAEHEQEDIGGLADAAGEPPANCDANHGIRSMARKNPSAAKSTSKSRAPSSGRTLRAYTPV